MGTRVTSDAVTDVLIASDANWIIDEVSAVLANKETTIRVVGTGAEVRGAVGESTPDLVVLDQQIGNMGGMAASIDLHLESGAGRLPEVPVLMLLDRVADVYLAKQTYADGWLVKPLDAFRLRKAINALLAGETYKETTAAGVS